MVFWIHLVGLGLSIAAALVIGLADAWLSRSMLIYLDALEANVAKVVKLLREGGTQLDVTNIDLNRDGGQNQARAMKTLGWFALALSFGVQIAALCLGRFGE